MSFLRRYADSLLSSDPRPVSEPVPRRVPGVVWWRRYLTSLFDMPPARQVSQRVVRTPAAEPAVEAPASRGPVPKRVLRSGLQVQVQAAPAPAGPKTITPAGGSQVIPASASNSSRPWGWIVAVAGLCLVVGLFTVTNRPSPDPGAGATVSPAPTGISPTSTQGQPGQLLWKGTLTFAAQPDSSTMPVVATPATALLADNATLYVCAGCSPHVIDGNQVAPWSGTKPPTFEQCDSMLNAPASGPESVPVRVGQMGCFSTSDGDVGYFTLLTTSPVSASAVIWSA